MIVDRLVPCPRLRWACAGVSLTGATKEVQDVHAQSAAVPLLLCGGCCGDAEYHDHFGDLKFIDEYGAGLSGG